MNVAWLDELVKVSHQLKQHMIFVGPSNSSIWLNQRVNGILGNFDVKGSDMIKNLHDREQRDSSQKSHEAADITQEVEKRERWNFLERLIRVARDLDVKYTLKAAKTETPQFDYKTKVKVKSLLRIQLRDNFVSQLIAFLQAITLSQFRCQLVFDIFDATFVVNSTHSLRWFS